MDDLKPKNIDYGLYLVTDQKLAGANNIVDVVKRAILGGVSVVQYRDKDVDTGLMIKMAEQIYEITKSCGVPLIVNDRVDVMMAIDADGVHVGQSDMPARLVRSLIGPDKILGVSVKTVDQAIKAVDDGADYLGVGDIFGTATKKDAGLPIGLDVLRAISAVVKVPIVGIGGINDSNAQDVILNGADGIAVISAIVGKNDPKAAAKKLSSIIKDTKRNKL